MIKLEINDFGIFPVTNVSGVFVVSPYFLEHILNLFYQGYVGEVWCEVQDTLINHKSTIENTVYGIIAEQQISPKEVKQ